MNRPYSTPKIVTDSCVELHDSIAMSVQRIRFVPKKLIRTAIACFGVLGTLQSFLGFFEIQIYAKILLGFALLLTVINGWLWQKEPFPFRRGCVFYGAAIVYSAMHFPQLLRGYSVLYETIRASVSELEFSYDAAHLTNGWNDMACCTLMLCLVVLFLSLIISYYTTFHPHLLPCFLCTFPFLELGLFFGFQTDSAAVVILVAFWVAVLSMQRATHKFSVKQSQTGFYRRGNIFYAKPGMRFMTIEITAFLLLVTIWGIGAVVGVIAEKAPKNAWIESKRMYFRTQFRSIRWNELTEFAQNLKFPFSNGSASDEINLADRGDLSFTGETVFELELPGDYTPQTIYLKNAVHSVYTGKGWATLDAAVLQNWNSLYIEMQSVNIMPQCLGYELWNRMEDDTVPLTIRTADLHSVNFTPYHCIYDENAEYIDDTLILLDDRKNYTFRIDPDPLSSQYDFSDLCEAYAYESSLLQDYEVFCRVNYSILTETSELNEIREAVVSRLTSTSYSLEEALQAIYTYLSESADYSMQPPKTPADRDYVTYFLQEGKKGYCTHYASAAVVLCRMLGIPARYCQGYVIFESDFYNADLTTLTDGKYTMSVKDTNSHAWAEVFLPDYGWIPFEATEGYYTDQNPNTETTPATTVSSVSQSTMQTTSTATQTTSSSQSTTSDTAETSQQSSMIATGSIADGHGDLSKIWSLVVMVLLILFGIAVVLGAVIWYCWFRHSRIIQKRNIAMYQADPNEAASASYGYLLRLLRRQHIEQGNLSHEMFALYAEEQCGLIPAGAMVKAVQTQLAVTFGTTKVFEEDAAQIVSLAQMLAKGIYDQSGKCQRFMMRWILHDIA